MAVSKAQKLATARYEGKTYDKLTTRLLIGERAQIIAAADARGESLAAYVRRAIAAQMERDGLPEDERITATIAEATERRRCQQQPPND